jgi:serine/threonine protein kinase
MASQLETLAHRYYLESEIARGGMGSVWRARDEVLARTVAVKILHAKLSSDRAFLDRFRREALAAARLAHPNIVSIYDTGSEKVEDEDRQHHYIVMEYCGRGTLADIIAAGPTGAERVVSVGSTICDALGYAHTIGVIHRDVKPANVLITDDGNLKVADFGIAKAAFVTSDITTTGAILGTVTYLSPEQARGQEPDSRSDIYSLGIVLYELATGRPPFDEENQIAIAMKHLREEPPPLRSIRAGVPRSLEAVILKALRKDPEARYATAHEMSAALEASLPAAATSVLPARRRSIARERQPSPERIARQAPQSGTDLRWLWGLLAIAVLVVALAIAVPALLDEQQQTSAEEPSRDEPDPPASDEPITIAAAQDFDPYGDDEEHSEEVVLAYDGDAGTAWETENYSSPLEAQGKAGVGVVFDLGEPREVGSIELAGDLGDFEVRYSDDIGADVAAFDVADKGDDYEIVFEDPLVGRYWLVWITALPNDIGTASIGEVLFSAP